MDKVTATLALTGVLTITLNRPAARNAFDQALVRGLRHHLSVAAADKNVLAVVLTGSGSHFCAGGDITWMRDVMQMPPGEMHAAASEIAQMLESAYTLPQPLVALVQGAAMGGGLGLACCADIVLADETARFGLGEVRLGIIPALISPYLIRAIGERKAAAMALLAEPVGPTEAQQLGIVTQICSQGALAVGSTRLVASLLRGGPESQRRTKSLLRKTSAEKIELQETTSQCIAEIVAAWQAPEATEGMQAFLDKRPPRWGRPTPEEVKPC